ncbi:MAG: hypothetical protein J5982_03340 [Bacilli bacterium]|nr:hypothetical protein [Bacilli bacterium]
MYIVTSPDSSFTGEFTGYKFKNGNCITELDENMQKWFKMLGFKVNVYEKPEKKNEKPKNENENAEENADK